jgi:catechol 2,3-dioxygenase-like lactoylglutathione lyase family enzyme
MSDRPAAARSEVRIGTAVPTFLVDDVGATARWYAAKLGFRTMGHFPGSEPYAYASIQRGGAEIMLLRLAGYEKPDLSARRPEGLWDAYIRMSGVAALHAAAEERDLVHSPLQKRPYGDWEFEVRDPNGYVLVFGGDADL